MSRISTLLSHYLLQLVEKTKDYSWTFQKLFFFFCWLKYSCLPKFVLMIFQSGFSFGLQSVFGFSELCKSSLKLLYNLTLNCFYNFRLRCFYVFRVTCLSFKWLLKVVIWSHSYWSYDHVNTDHMTNHHDQSSWSIVMIIDTKIHDQSSWSSMVLLFKTMIIINTIQFNH